MKLKANVQGHLIKFHSRCWLSRGFYDNGDMANGILCFVSERHNYMYLVQQTFKHLHGRNRRGECSFN